MGELQQWVLHEIALERYKNIAYIHMSIIWQYFSGRKFNLRNMGVLIKLLLHFQIGGGSIFVCHRTETILKILFDIL